MSLVDELQSLEPKARREQVLILAARAYHAKADVECHGNGFIQIPVPGFDGARIHVWGHPDIPRQRVYTGVHNHRFAFRSVVVRGVLRHQTYDVVAVDDGGPPPGRIGRGHYLAVGDDERGLHRLALRVSVLVRDSFRFREGHTYGFPPGWFHQTTADGPTVTVMEKKGRALDAKPLVLLPVGVEPDNDFDRRDPDHLWRVAFTVLREGLDQ